MFFFFKRSTIHLDCFTDRPDVYSFTPIVMGSECLPEWWKKLKKTDFDFDFDNFKSKNNMKSCAGLIDFFSKSVCIRLWSDLAIRIKSSEKIINYQFADSSSSMHFHPKEQYKNYLNEEYCQFKITSPWYFNCNDDINWTWVGNSWNQNLTDDTHFLPGSVNFKRQMTTNIHAIVKFEGNLEKGFILNHNTPLVNLFPMSEKKVKIHNHLMTKDELFKYRLTNYSPIVLNKVYYYVNRLKKEKEQKSKCPFHF